MSESTARPANLDVLIREAYRVVADPVRLGDMQEAIARQAAIIPADGTELDQHFGQASEMFDSILESEARDFSSFGIDGIAVRAASDPGSLVRLDSRLRIVGIDNPRLERAEMAVEEDFADWLASDDDAMERGLRALAEGASANAAMVIRFFTSADDQRGSLGLAVRSHGADGEVVTVRRMGLQWSERDKPIFADVFGLTETETELVRYLVEGRSVSEFAEERGRAVGTARTQLKRLQQKLAVGTQSEVISLYAGFIGLLASDSLGTFDVGDAGQSHSVTVEGELLRFERLGLPGGTPVLLLHGAVEGPYLPEATNRAARAAGLELIVPWMPFYTGSDAHLKASARIESFADLLPAFLNALDIGRCAVLACSMSTAYAFAAISRHPDKFTGLVLAGMAMPLGEIADRDRAAMNPAWRAPMELGARFPRFFELFARAIFRLAMRGEAHHYFDRLFRDSPRDRAVLRTPDVARTMRRAAENRPDRFGAAMAHGFAIMTTDWSPWLDDIKRPVRLVFGKEDVVAPPAQMRNFAETRGIVAVGPLRNVAGFSLFQAPEKVFAEVQRLAVVE